MRTEVIRLTVPIKMAERLKNNQKPLSDIFVLKNVPPNYDEQNIKDYVETTLDMDVDKVITYPCNHERALVFLKEKLQDFDNAAALINAEKLESLELFLLQTYRMPAVVVTEIDFDKLEKEFLQMYLEVTFGDCDDIVKKCETWPSHKAAVVHFASEFQAAVDEILAYEDHIPLPSEDYHIKIHPCFYNFNDKISPDDVILTETSGQDLSSEYESDGGTHSDSEGHTSGSEDSEKSRQDDDSSSEDSDNSLNDEKKLKGKTDIQLFKQDDTQDENTDKDSDSENSSKSGDDSKLKSIPDDKGRCSTFRGRGRGVGTIPLKTTGASKAIGMIDKVSTDDSSKHDRESDMDCKENNDENNHKYKDVQENSCDSDNNIKQKSFPDRKVTTFRGRGSGLMKTKLSEKKKASKSSSNNDKVNTDESSSDSETSLKQHSTSSIKPTSLIGRGGIHKRPKGEKQVEEQKMNDLKNKTSTDKDEEGQDNIQQNINSSSKTTAFRGRGSGYVKSKSTGRTQPSNEAASNEESNSDEDSTSGSEHHVHSKRQSNSKLASSRGTTQSLFNRNNCKRNSVPNDEVDKDECTDEDIEKKISNSDETKFDEVRTIGTRGLSNRGRGRGLANAINPKSKKSDEEDKTKKQADLQKPSFASRGNFTQRGRGIYPAPVKVNTTFSEKNSAEKDGYSKESQLSKNETDKNAKLLSQKVEELERRKKEMEEENARLKEEIIQIKMTPLQAKCLEQYMKTLNECKVYYDTEASVAVLKGPHYVMQKYHCDFLVELRKVKDMSIPLSTDVESILSTDKGKIFLQKLNNLELKNAFVELNTNTLVVASLVESLLNETVKLIKEKVEFSETFTGKADIPLNEINTLKFKIEYMYMTKVIWDEKKCQLVVTGIKDDVKAARKDVENFLENFGISEKSFDVEDPLANYFFLCLEDQVKFFTKSVKFTNYTFTEHQIAFRFQGSKAETSQVLRNLDALKIQTKILKWDLLEDFKAHDIFLIVHCFKSEKLKDIEKKYQYKKVLLDFSKLSSFKLKASETKNKKKCLKSDKTTPIKVSTPPTSSTVKSASANELTFSMTNSCQLIIKSNGDIVQENSDILVSVLGTDLDLRKTRVGGAFHHACKFHWKEVNLSHKANPNPHLVTVKNPVDLKCMAVCHIILEPWDQNTSSSKLIAAIQQVLNEAKNLGAKTISFPPLGCGAAFKFPPSDVAQAMLQVFQSLNVASFLQKIILLAPDSNFLNELKSRASTQYKSVQATPVAAAVSVPQANVPQTNPDKDASDDSTDDSDDDFLKLENSSTNKSDNATEVTITTQHENNFAELKKQLKQDLQELCLYTDYFNQERMKYWPGKSRQKIVESAKQLSVWIEKSPHPKKGFAGFLLKGEKSAVTEVKLFIEKEYLEILTHLPKKSMSSDTAPKRGTLEFMHYATESDEPFPSYWSLNESKSFWKAPAKYTMSLITGKKLLVNVDQNVKDAISKLVIGTFDKKLVGMDKQDAAGLTHTSLKVVEVQRVENVELFDKYHEQRKNMFNKNVRMQNICADIRKLPGSKGSVETTKFLNEAMKKELYYEVNEHYLFYGTDNFEHLIKHGLDPRSAEINGLFGKGIYATEMSTKADQYSDLKSNRKPNGTPMTLILARVLLGNVFLCNDQNIKAGKKFSRPPCMNCLEDRCKCPKQTLFDSVMGDGSRLFRQFVIYEKNQFYPEYVIKYIRE